MCEKCRTPFGISDRQQDSEFARKNLELSCDSEKMLAFFKAFDQQNVKEASKNSESWFKKSLSEEALGDTLYRWTAQESKEGKYAPLVRIKISETGRKPTNIYACTRMRTASRSTARAARTRSSKTPSWCRSSR